MTRRAGTARGGMRHAWAIACIVCLLTVAQAPGHIVYGSPSVYQLVLDSDLVVRARIGDSSATVDRSVDRPVVVAEVLHVYRGSHERGVIRFAQHGHGVAPYRAGDEALLFLRRAERVRELDGLAAPGETVWVSLQEHDTAYTMTPSERPEFDAAVRAWVAAATCARRRRRGLRSDHV